MTFSLYTVGRVEAVEQLRNGGIVFAVVERPHEKFFLLDDEMTGELKERYIPGIDGEDDGELPSLQSITDAGEILARVINEKAYVVIYMDELFGFSIYRLEYSPVPGYAMMTYKDPCRTEEERRELLQFTKFASENSEFYEAAYGKYVAIKNAQVVQVLYRTPSDIEVSKGEKMFCFRVGVMGIDQAKCFFRVANSTRPCGLLHPVDLEDAHFVPVTVLFEGQIVSSTSLYMVDSGADETSFPGYYDSGRKCFFSVENSRFDFPVVDVVGISTANGDKAARRVRGEFFVQVGTLEPIKLESLSVDKTAPPFKGDKRKNYKNTLILGRDVLFKLSGCWFPGCDGKTQLSLENAPLHARRTEENAIVQGVVNWTNMVGKQAAKVGGSFGGIFATRGTKEDA